MKLGELCEIIEERIHMKDSPCYMCVWRSADCHATCSKYVEYQQERFAYYEEKFKKSEEKNRIKTRRRIRRS